MARKFIFTEKPDLIINIVDATSLERSLYLTTQLLELDTKVIIAINMSDILEKRGTYINIERLEKLLETKVIKISALHGTGINELFNNINTLNTSNKLHIYDSENVEELAKKNNMDLEEFIATQRYRFIEKVKKQIITKKEITENISDKLDKIFINKWLGIPIFVIIMSFIYYISVGVIGNYTINFIEKMIDNFSVHTQLLLEDINASNWIISLIIDGIISGVGSVLSFIPQLIMLFFCMTILENTGYMSRIAFILDKIFRKIGLNGKSLIPFIIGSGCSVPGIMGTRIIENQNEREMTAILTPFIPCSAKLPIISMLSEYFFGNNSGLISVSLYFLSILIIIFSAILMKKYIYKDNNSTYISELPEYRLPSIKHIIKDVYEKIIAFIKRAGSVILICSIILWFLLSFSFRLEYGVDINNSILACIGKSISWIFSPIIGRNSWEATVSILQGLIAKEQVISSMSVISGLSEQSNILFDKEGVFNFFTPISAYSFIVFNLFSAPCFGTLAAMNKELGKSEKTINVIIFQTILAWFISTFIYQIGTRIEKQIISISDILIIMSIVILIIKILIYIKKNNRCRTCTYCNSCNKN